MVAVGPIRVVKLAICMFSGNENNKYFTKFARPLGHRRVRSQASNILLILIIQFIELTARTRGQPREPASQNGHRRRIPGGSFWSPNRPEAEHPSIFDRPNDPSKIDPFLGPLKIDPRERQSRYLAALWPPRAPFGSILGSILAPIFY